MCNDNLREKFLKYIQTMHMSSQTAVAVEVAATAPVSAAAAQRTYTQHESQTSNNCC